VFYVSLTDDEVKHVAKLAAIQVSDSEIPVLKEQLNSILTYVERLSEIPTRGVTPTYHVHGISNVFRDDVHQPSLGTEELSENAPDFAEGFFRVPRIIKEG
jgi:aspartyl-tRNA(Asn)/glutamyl-tRNA(Gln) amidotransferase subunit C